MPEINNALAAQIQVPQVDLGGTLAKIAQINSLNASTEKTQQEVQHNKFLYDQGGGYTPSELQTRADTQQRHMENAGRIGNAYLANPTDAAWSASVDEAEKVGLIRGGSLEKAQYLSLPPAKREGVAKALQAAGQSSTENITQNPNAIAGRAAGQKAGELTGGLAPAPDSGPTSGGGPRPKVSLIEANRAAEGSAEVDKQQLSQYQQEQRTAGPTKAALQQMKLDAARVRTGALADREQNSRKLMVALGDTFPALKQYTDKFSNSTAAFESLDKNAGIVAREAQKSVSGTAASELDAISKTLASTSTTNKGIDINASQLIGLKNYESARASAAETYYQSGTLKGFAAQFNKNAGPAAWIYMSLPGEEQDSIKAELNKSEGGKRTWNSIIGQIYYIHKNKLDEGLD